MEQIRFSVDRCVMCGIEVEEGRWVCTGCEQRVRNVPRQPTGRTGVQKNKRKKFRWFCRKKAEK